MTLSLLICDKIQATYQWMFPQSRNFPFRRHDNINQSLDNMIFILSHLLRLVLGILPIICQLVCRLFASPEWYTILCIPTDSDVLSYLSCNGTIVASLPNPPPLCWVLVQVFWFRSCGLDIII